MELTLKQLKKLIKEETAKVLKENKQQPLDEGSKESAKAQDKLLKYLEKDGWRIDFKHHVISAKPPAKLDPLKQIVVNMHSAHGKGAGDTFADYRRIGKLYGVNKDVMMKAVEEDLPTSAMLKETWDSRDEDWMQQQPVYPSGPANNGKLADRFEGMLNYLENQLVDTKQTNAEQLRALTDIKKLIRNGDIFRAAYKYEKYFGESLTSQEKSTLNSIYQEFG